jgi:hypothetical protein
MSISSSSNDDSSGMEHRTNMASLDETPKERSTSLSSALGEAGNITLQDAGLGAFSQHNQDIKPQNDTVNNVDGTAEAASEESTDQ